MRQNHSRAVVAARPTAQRVSLSMMTLLLLTLLLVPRLGHAAPPAKDDVLGRWVADRAQPDLDYTVRAGPDGKLIVEVPAKAVGRPKGETVMLDRVGPAEFATPKGGKTHASFKLSGPRRAEFKMMLNRPDAFNLTDQLLERP
ncbi:hypothetical protein [Phenylobacterium sp.]|jgi:hypothetical protein|uniref:hypothetical protein n=1 Tax=Phenylobacterium sp. TaxID=1871053 RepID=UPI002E2FED2A|nr:hypothetical protein [Phenylobacterium sp.]HEX3365245.1 hypothetical protein [Phenylobacterium sp.]